MRDFPCLPFFYSFEGMDIDDGAAQFWLSNPNVLFKDIDEVWPQPAMSFTQKLNAITRTIIALTAVGAATVRRKELICVSGALSLMAIVVLYYYRDRVGGGGATEPFFNMSTQPREDASTSVCALAGSVAGDAADDDDEYVEYVEYVEGDHTVAEGAEVVLDESNPFGNVMVPEYGTASAERAAAPERQTEQIYDKVKSNTIKLFQNEDEIEDGEIKDKLFASLGDNYMFASSMRNYVTNPNTSVMNNQGAFAEFCYGKMGSVKEAGIHPS